MKLRILTAVIGALLAGAAGASSHREAPLITESPKVDSTDLYMFRSYETGRAGFVTLIANYQPFQDPFGGPNYFFLDPKALYEIHVDNNGDANEDITFQFRFQNNFKNLALPVGGLSIAVPILNLAPFGPGVGQGDAMVNLVETYSVNVVRGDRRTGTPEFARNAGNGNSSNSGNPGNTSAAATTFRKPLDNIGMKSIADYATYADNHIYRFDMGACGEGRVFAGQRREGFAVNVGELFDLYNTNPFGPVDGERNALERKNITSIALEVPIACLTGSGPIIGAWQTASLPRKFGPNDVRFNTRNGQERQTEQVSRLGAPLVNEVVIGLPDKDLFNSAEPTQDGPLAKYVTNPSFPEIIEVLYPAAKAPNKFPRTDLVSVFLTGIEGVNKPANVVPSEMLRLNTSTAPAAAAAQNSLGVIAGDTAGFPNGRRPGDDVVDIELRVLMGVLLPIADAPSGQLPFTDGVATSAARFLNRFPYLNHPLPGSPSDAPIN